MNTTKSIIRIAVLFTLCALGLFLIFNIGDPNEPIIIFCLRSSLEVAIGIICFIITGHLYFRWSKTDKWLMKYEGWIKEAEEAHLKN